MGLYKDTLSEVMAPAPASHTYVPTSTNINGCRGITPWRILERLFDSSLVLIRILRLHTLKLFHYYFELDGAKRTMALALAALYTRERNCLERSTARIWVILSLLSMQGSMLA